MKKAILKLRSLAHRTLLPPVSNDELEVYIVNDTGPNLEFMYSGIHYTVPWTIVSSVSHNSSVDTIEETKRFMEEIMGKTPNVTYTKALEELIGDELSHELKLAGLFDMLSQAMQHMTSNMNNIERLNIDYIDLSGYRVQCYLSPTKGEDLSKGRYKLCFGAKAKGSKKKALIAIEYADKPSQCIDKILLNVVGKIRSRAEEPAPKKAPHKN